MAQFPVIAATLKRLLREKRLTYKQVGERIGLTESGVKKFLNGNDGSVERIADICDLLGVSLVEVLQETEQNPEHFMVRGRAERWFIAHPQDWYFLSELHQQAFDLDAVRTRHALDEKTTDAYVEALEHLGFIRRTADGGVVSKMPPHNSVGVGKQLGEAIAEPLHRGLLEHVRSRMRGESDRDQANLDSLWFGHGMMPEQLAEEMQQALSDVVSQYFARAKRQTRWGSEDGLVRIGTLVASAPFELCDAISLSPREG